MFEIKNSKGQVFVDKIENPACFFDSETYTLMKIGEKDVVEDMYIKYKSAYLKAGCKDAADKLIFKELPKEQEILDKVFNISGYCKNFMNN